jgi:ribA/ribD-fused uncharacterized protein
LDIILSFHGEHRFLSNFYEKPVFYEDRWYPTSEHAYVAAKTTNSSIRDEIMLINSPGKIKRFGRTIQIRSDWDSIKVSQMRIILESKFRKEHHESDFSEPLFPRLKSTGNALLIEGNTWGDTFWGQCPIGTGKNMLGKLLMSIRDDIEDFFE